VFFIWFARGSFIVRPVRSPLWRTFIGDVRFVSTHTFAMRLLPYG